MLRVHKIQLDPNRKQSTYFSRSCGVSRFAYNWGLARWQEEYKQGKKPNEAALRRQLNSIKKTEFPWMDDVGKCAPQQAIKNLGMAYNRFFQGLGKYPRFKKKGQHDSFRADNGPPTRGADAVKIKGKTIALPRIGIIRLRECPRFVGQIKSATISREADRWFVSITIDTTEGIPQTPKNHGAVGIDLGVKNLATLSTGESVAGTKPYRRLAVKLKRVQRSVSRKKKGSANRRRQVYKLQNLHARIANLRRETLHQLSHQVTKRFTVIGMEDLNVKGMVSNHKLARAIQDMGFYEFRRQIEYKAKQRGVTVVFAPRFYPSTKKCSDCKSLMSDLTLADREWTCLTCGKLHDRDMNAAINLREYAVSSMVLACGEEGSGLARKGKVKPASMKQELSCEVA